jgi:carboxypeptidase Taq
MDISKDLNLVKNYEKEIIVLSRIGALLGWDQQTYMPQMGVDERAEESAYISKLIHRKFVSDEFFEAVKRLKEKNTLKGDDRILIERTYKDVSKARKIPEDFVEELSRVSSKAFSAWQEARKKNDFEMFRPHLEKVIELKRREAKLLNVGGHLYNGLLDSFEEGMTVEELKPKFEELKIKLRNLLDKIENSEVYKKQKKKILIGNFDSEKQMELVKDVIHRIGLKDDFSRIDFSTHPFSTKIGMRDLRITTGIRDNPLFSFESSIHEAGHALYEYGMPEQHSYDFLGDSPSLGIHESQSRFWENMISKSKNFWEFYYPKFKESFGLKGSFEEFYKELNYVEPGFIRIESDEIHYCLHIILRFEIEMGLIDGSIKVENLPEIWNEKMKELFNVVPDKVSNGVLQDVHWSDGYIGYFPTYAIGTIYSAQIYDALIKQVKNVEEDIKKGDYSHIIEWLRKNIHNIGKRKLTKDIIKDISGSGMDIDVFVDYLEKKYRDIYKF